VGVLTLAALNKEISTGQLHPVYLVLGDDEHEKGELIDRFEEAIDEGFRAFNVKRFHGEELASPTNKVGFSDVISAAKTLPMMSPHRIVIVLRAEHSLQPKRESQSASKDLEELEEYLINPVPTTSLVLVAEGLDERRRISKLLLKHAMVIRSGQLNNVEDAQRWIRSQVRTRGAELDPEAARFLADITGPDIGRLRGEVDRLLLYASTKGRITVDDVREVAGSAVAYDDWAVTRAIEQGATALALRKLALALDSGAVPQMVLGQLGWIARTKLSGARVSEAVEAVFRTDLALKRSAGEPRILLERLVAQLCCCSGDTGRHR